MAEALRGRRLLLVVDNCEHVLVAAASAVETILGRSRTGRILATSREPLAVDGETVRSVEPLALNGGVTSDAVTLFVDRARAVRLDFGLSEPATAAAVIEICATVDGLPLGIELAAARMAAMSAVDVRDRLADRFRLLKGSGPERQLTLRHAVEWSYDLLTDDERELLVLTSVFVGGFDLTGICAVVDGADDVEVLGISTPWSGSRCSSPTTAPAAPATASSRRSGSSPRIGWRRPARSSTRATGTPRTSPRSAPIAGSAGTGPGGGTRSTGWRPSWATCVPASSGAPLGASSRWRPTSPPTPHSMGFSVQLFETLAWAEELLEPAAIADVRRLPRLYTAAGYACFAGRAEAARSNAHRAAELERTVATTAVSRGMRRSSRRWAACTAVIWIATSSSPVPWPGRYGRDRGYGLAAYVDGLQSCGRIEDALELTEDAVAAARSLGNPYWISYALWIAGMAFSKADVRRAFAAWDEGVAFVREHRVHFFEGFLARDAARLHTSDGEPEVALVLFADAITAFHRAGNVPQLIITLASVPALFERLDRLAPAAMLLGALSREPSSFHHVPELADLGDRVSRKLGTGPHRGAVIGGSGARSQ